MSQGEFLEGSGSFASPVRIGFGGLTLTAAPTNLVAEACQGIPVERMISPTKTRCHSQPAFASARMKSLA